MNVNLRIKFPWWTTPYVKSCGLFARLFNLEPDEDKIKQTILKHSVSLIKRDGKWVTLIKDLR